MKHTNYCSRCKVTGVPLVKYSKGVGNTVQYYLCRDCNAKRLKDYYDKTKLVVYEHYGNECACCGENNILFLSIDHVNNDGHLDRWPSGYRRAGYTLYSKIKTAGFPKTLQLLCMNCNYGKRMNNGTCPHIALAL